MTALTMAVIGVGLIQLDKRLRPAAAFAFLCAGVLVLVAQAGW